MFIIYIYSLYLLFVIYTLTNPNTIIKNKYVARFFLVNMVFISIWIVGNVDLDYADRDVYSRVFFEIQGTSTIHSLTNIDWEPMFIILIKLISTFTSDLIIFYIILHIAFLFILLKGFKKIFSNTHLIVTVFFIYLNYSFYFSYTLNGLRQGFALALLVLAIGYVIEGKKAKTIIISVLAIGFHYTATPFSLSIIIVYFFKNIKIKHLVIFYLLLAIFYLLDINSFLFEFIIPSNFEGYSQDVNIGTFGGSNKIQFLFFNTVCLILFLYYLKNKVYKDNQFYQMLLKVYIIFSIYFLMFGFIAYSNRLAIYSWFFIPLLLGVVIYKSKNHLLKITILFSIITYGYITVISKFVF